MIAGRVKNQGFCVVQNRILGATLNLGARRIRRNVERHRAAHAKASALTGLECRRKNGGIRRVRGREPDVTAACINRRA